jgi:hypothetical protein
MQGPLAKQRQFCLIFNQTPKFLNDRRGPKMKYLIALIILVLGVAIGLFVVGGKPPASAPAQLVVPLKGAS